MNEAILDKKIKTWEDQLLDLGKRNKMISFRESKRSTLKILKPGFQELYQQIVVDEKELTFQKAIDRDSDVRVYSILTLLDQLSYPMEVNIGDIRAEGSMPEIRKTLKHLRSKARLAMDEQGTNILYLVFGFIEWKEKGNRTENWIRSPLLLVPVSLLLPSLNAQYSLKKHEDEVVVNPTLDYLFERDYGIKLPNFDSDKDSLESFMQKMEELVDDRGWRILRECSMGLVSFLKISMYNDLIRNELQLKQNPIIRAFAGERNEVNKVDDAHYQFDHDACRSVDTFQVLDADSSQQDAIALSQQGVSFVMQGPPGTGKSQTITNIIAQALADGKKVLFVSEKMAALEVVYRRLTDVHLADFCLSLHSHKANKKEILNQLGANLHLQRLKVKDEEIAKLTRLDMIREQLKAYVQDIHKTIMPLEMSLYEVYGAILELGSLPDIEIQLDNVDGLTKDDVNRLALLVQNLDKAQGVLGPQWYKNPWQGITGSYLEVSQKRELQNKLQDVIRILGALEECKLVAQTLADVLSIEKLDAFRDLYDHALPCSTLPNNWFHRSTEQEERTVRELRDQKQEIQRLRDMLSDRYAPEFFTLSGGELADTLVDAMKAYVDLLRTGESCDGTFCVMEADLQQVLRLDEYWRLLTDALHVFAEQYNLRLPKTCDSLQTAFKICDMLLEKRPLTPWYFGPEPQELLQYVTQLNQKLSAYVEESQRLCRRYSDAIVNRPDIQPLLQTVTAAEAQLRQLVVPQAMGYAGLTEVASFDLGKLQKVEDTLNGDAMRTVSNVYGLPTPATLEQVQVQIAVLEKVRHNEVVPAWNTPSARAKAKQLLQIIISKTEKLAEDKENLKAFFEKVGITADVGRLSAEEVSKFQQIDRAIPEAAAIVNACHQDQAYRLLDTVEVHAEQSASLEKQICALRTEYRIRDTYSHIELLAALQERQDAVEHCNPCASWATSKTEAVALLEQASALAANLLQQRQQLLEIYEESVFTLDHTGMLNRFKGEYTNFLKIFKASYKEDMKQVRLAFKEVRKKVTDDEVIALLQTLRQYHEEMAQYRNLAAQASALLNVSEYDLHFDWNGIQKHLGLFDTVSNLFRNDAAAYQFLTRKGWDAIYDALTRYAQLHRWFADNPEAQGYYGAAYLGAQTDTGKIRDLLNRARTVSSLFATPEHYIRYLQAPADASAAKQQAADLVSARDWFREHAAEIDRYTGMQITEDAAPWQETLRHLNVFESIVAATDETSGYAMVARYRTDHVLLDAYLTALEQIARIQEFAAAVYHLAADPKQIRTVRLRQLMTEIRAAVSNAESALSVYRALGIDDPDTDLKLSIHEVKADLEAAVLYQHTRDHLPEIEADAQSKLGQMYRGSDTDWNGIRANIAFCHQIPPLLCGAVSEELITAFTQGTVLYSEAQLSELRQTYDAAVQIEAAYPLLEQQKDLDTKARFLVNVSAALNAAVTVKNTVASVAYSQCRYGQTVDDLKKLAQLQHMLSRFNTGLTQAQQSIPALSMDSNTDWDSTVAIFDHLRQVKRALSIGGFDEETVQFVTNGIPGITVAAYGSQIEKLMRSRSLIRDITGLFAGQATLEAAPLTKLLRRISNCYDQFATMDAWIDLRDCRKACVDNGLEAFVTKAEDVYYPAGRLHDVFFKSFYYEWFEKICAGIESVATFRVRTQEDRVETFRELDCHQLPVDQMRIRERLIREMPTAHNSVRATDEMSILNHELGKKRSIMPLRKLFRTIPNLLLRLKPCLMMSPLSVAYFLEAETYRFDMVIFDEASQIFPQDAIGAIFRGKQVIIAGDSKQLPPTSFFSVSTSNDDDFDVDDEDAVEMNFDSILEEASNSLLNRSLLWHYRSRFEELISFSNQQIYQNNLITFPSSTVQAPDTGVEYVYVKDGVYEGRCNRGEAQQIVQLVAQHIRKYPNRSLGVIAFSESQQSVIEDEIHQFRMRNPAFEKFFDEDKDEPFFVKNLENVQGDERDTIIFSICYAKNAQGRMFMRFGPLGQQGGERRLNVAITRAKHNVKLVGSIYPEDIDLSKTQSEGVRMLRTYIAFAIHGTAALPKPEKKNTLYDVDTFSEQVGKFLKSRGFTVQMNVGSSDYTIDIAVEHPKKPGHYIAGIECDGNSYYMARTVRDREHLRAAVLERMGWNMYRVWSTEWIRNPQAEKERLLAFIQSALSHHGERMPTEPTEDANEIVGTEVLMPNRSDGAQDTENPYGLPLYEAVGNTERPLRPGEEYWIYFAGRIRETVRVEQPIHLDVLYKRLEPGKVTQIIRDNIDRAIAKYLRGETVTEDRFIRMVSMQTVPARRSPLGSPDRNIEHISIPEIAAVMEKILVGAYGMERAILCSEAAKVFGFERSGPRIKQRTSEAVDYLVRTKKVSDYDDKIQLLEGT